MTGLASSSAPVMLLRPHWSDDHDHVLPARLPRLLEPVLDQLGEGAALTNLGFALQDVGRFEEAITAYRTAASRSASHGSGHRTARVCDRCYAGSKCDPLTPQACICIIATWALLRFRRSIRAGGSKDEQGLARWSAAGSHFVPR
jgi:hypothetical protein